MNKSLLNLYHQKELTTKRALNSFFKIIKQLKFIRNIRRAYQDNDEPKFFQFISDFQISETSTDGRIDLNGKPGGSSFFSEELALLKCLGETVERYACTSYKRSNLIKGSYNELKEKALDPNTVVTFSLKQKKLPLFKRFNFTDKTLFTWVIGQSLIDGMKKFIPAQLVYHSYKFEEKEGVIYLPISTGAAGGSCLESAIVRGILEIIERDSFMIFYLNKLSGVKINLEKIKDERVQFLNNICLRYRLKWHIVDIATNLGIPVFVSLVTDKTTIGPAVTVGLKSHLNPIEAIIGSFEESLHARCWMRHTFEDAYDKYKKLIPRNITSIQERGIYWYLKKMLKHLDFWINQEEKSLYYNTANANLTHGKILKKLIDILMKINCEIYYVDLTLPELQQTSYKIVKVIIPDLQPVYLNENFPYLGGNRLHQVPQILGYKTKTLNKIPHPFL